MTRIYGNKASEYWRTYVEYSTSQTSTAFNINVSAFGVYWSKHHEHTMSYNRPSTLSCTDKTATTYTPSAEVTRDAGGTWNFKTETTTYSYSRKTSSRTVTLTGSINHSQGGSEYRGISTAKVSFTVPALPQYKVSFDKNTTASVTGMPSAIYAYHGVSKKLNVSVPKRTGYVFNGWKRTSNNVIYWNGDSFSTTGAFTFYAQWKAVDAPTCYYTSLSKSKTSGGNIIKDYTTVTCTISGLEAQHGRSVSSVVLKIGNATSNPRTTDGTLTINGSNLVVGTYNPTLTLTDSAGAVRTYTFNKVTVVAPKWEREMEVQTSPLAENPPALTKDGYGVFEWIKLYNYTKHKWDVLPYRTMKVKVNESSWSFYFTADEDHISSAQSDPTLKFATIAFAYKHYDIIEKPTRQAFFTTSRNQNFSNGIYNVMFVGGVDNTTNPNYSSRVWWSQINNPLYFPESNFSEVGSNDTAIQGLTKVGDYLAVVKQSKTIDTAIFLLYPTSFEEETTYAVKQGVQGVGALSKYSFNILGDETLFLSPNGVMAIVPTQDEEHKVQNRSYFIDGKMLKEENVSNAYSFVHDGKYYLSMNNGHVYVLDGNQRNSWGNDRTVLVYEGYYLENVPAKCFVKYDDRLVFTDGNNICAFTKNNYADAYNATGDENVPVSAEWSTVFDDDGSLHYYKTMQKKGNVVSILPMDYRYIVASIDEDEFNENKSLYYILLDGEYVKCSADDEYDDEQTYYIRGRSATQVFVRKDGNNPIEIQRKFGESSTIPSEMILNKKLKKYKRLQFIIRNDENEPFGIDEIVKSYTVGNYTKK